MSYVRVSDNARRKADHIYVAIHEDVEYHHCTAGFERFDLTYQALPEISRSEVDTSTNLFGHCLSLPFMISPVTGGTREASVYNHLFAETAQHFGIAMGVGSQRIALEEPLLAATFQVRDIAPDILLFANLGAVQLNYGHGVESCKRAVEMIGADALMLHLNPLQECVQESGNTDFHSLLQRIQEMRSALGVPVVIKEVGHGISSRTARLLIEAGVDGIDVAGAGGTSWVKVESLRTSDPNLSALGARFGEWGIPTVDSVLAVRKISRDIPLISSGGVRTGEDVAKSIGLGANIAGMALPLLKAASISKETLFNRIAQIREELITTMFCTGSRTIEDLHNAELTQNNKKGSAD